MLQNETGLREVRALRKQGRVVEALACLRRSLAAGLVPLEKLDAAGRALLDLLGDEGAPKPAHDVLLLGQCTTSFLKTALAALAHAQGTLLAVEEGGYDSVLQELAGRSSRPDVVIVLPWHQRLLAAGDRSPEDRVADELEFSRQVWALALERGSRLVQVGYDWTGPGPAGHALGAGPGEHVGLVRTLNAALRSALPPGAYFVDLEQVSGGVGRRSFYDARAYFWTKQPFSSRGVERLARHLWAGTRAVTTGPKKVLVLDLDNTLWGGVVGEDGPLAIRLGVGGGPEAEAFVAFQRYCRELTERGVLLAICSKNNPADAREAFEKNPNMLLRLDDFAAFEASWDAKSQALQRIAETLSLGLDSFVFFDDNPAERTQVQMALPSVEVVEVPVDPADFVAVLEDGLYFEAAVVTRADRERSEQYRSAAQRRVHQQSSGSLEEYLASLQMVADVRPIDAADLVRVAQLIGKTNQFNLTTRRHTAGDIQRLLAEPQNVGLSLRLQDRFGDYGLISLVIGVAEPDAVRPTLRIDTWLMSCRAIARGVELLMLDQIVRAARARGYEALLGEYIASAKNQLVAELYPKLGFAPLPASVRGTLRYALELGDYQPQPSAVSLR
jgi:FkbH-like protein